MERDEKDPPDSSLPLCLFTAGATGGLTCSTGLRILCGLTAEGGAVLGRLAAEAEAIRSPATLSLRAAMDTEYLLISESITLIFSYNDRTEGEGASEGLSALM